MQIRAPFAIAALCSTTFLVGCESMSPNDMLNVGQGAFKAATLSDQEVRQMSDEACAEMDSQAQVASQGSNYDQRLDSIANQLGHEVDGQPVNYKVYLSEQPNAWAMANGCIRVYSGLMDLMNDNEVTGVLGHEAAHVVLGHSKKAMQTAMAAATARDAAASSSESTVAALSRSQLGELGEKLINAQFSQSQEAAADEYSFELLEERGIDQSGLVTAFEKLAKLDGGESSMMSSHPGSAERAEEMRHRLAE